MEQQNTILNGQKETVITVKDVYKAFGDRKVLNGVTLDVKLGENVVVLGKSGTGKSVLIKIIAGLLKADTGIVNVLGHDMNTITAKDLRQLRLKIGYSFQSSALYDSMTVRENLEFALKHEGLNLLILKKLLKILPEDDLKNYILSRPMGKYSKILWYLYESFAQKNLSMDLDPPKRHKIGQKLMSYLEI